MAEVYRATVAQTAGADRMVVVKRMLPRLASDRAARAMFAEEARLGAHIRHDNVVRVLDYDTDSEAPFLVLEFVKGVDLWRLSRWLMRRGTPLAVPEAVFLLRQMLTGLHAVHEATDAAGQRLGIVHRDVSPSNVLLSIHGDIKLGDLGIARARLKERFPETTMGERAKGKLGYLAPEQVHGTDLDRRADVFSAGVIAAELLMGRTLFSGGSELAVLLAIRDAKIHPFIEYSSELPDGLGDVVIQALAAKPARRLPSAEDFAARLAPFQTGDRETLRASLAQMVVQAQRDAPTMAPMMATPTRTQSDPGGLLVRMLDDEGYTPIGGTRITDEQGTASYTIKTVSGEKHGPWNFARTVQAVSTGQLGPYDMVSVGGGKARRLAELTELSRHLPVSTMTTDHEGVEEAKSGAVVELRDGGIIPVLAHAAMDRVTGLLLCELNGIRKEIYVKDGVPAYVASNLAGELLGEYLVSKNVISRGELDMALAVMPRFEGRLGDTLAGLGLVEPVVLFRHIADQVRGKLLDLFLWSGGTSTQYLGVAPPASGFPLGLDSWEILDEGLRRRVQAGLEEDRLERWTRMGLSPASGPRLTAVRRSLPQVCRRLLSMLDQPLTLGRLRQHWPATEDPDAAIRAGLMLIQLKLVGWVER